MNTFDTQFLKAIGAAEQPDRRAPNDLALLLRERMDELQFIYEKHIGEVEDERDAARASRDRWKARWEKIYGLLMAVVAGVIWVSVGRWMGWV